MRGLLRPPYEPAWRHDRGPAVWLITSHVCGRHSPRLPESRQRRSATAELRRARWSGRGAVVRPLAAGPAASADRAASPRARRTPGGNAAPPDLALALGKHVASRRDVTVDASVLAFALAGTSHLPRVPDDVARVALAGGVEVDVAGAGAQLHV